MKKTATILALAGLSMAAKTEHSFLGRKPVEISAEIDPKMVIKPAHNIDPGMVRKPHRNIDPGMVIKPKKTQGTILTADDADDELLLIYRPADNIDPGMVRRPPVGFDIDPKFVIKPPRGFDDGIYVRPRPRNEIMYVDDEMRLVSGTEVDPGMVIKPRRGDIDPGMVRKPVKGWEIDPKIFVKPKRSDVLYADDDEMMVRRPNVENIKYDDELVYAGARFDQGMVRKPINGNIDKGIFIRPKDNIKYLDAENDDELAVVGHVREPRLIGDFPINWPGKPVYADAEDDELFVRTGVSDQGIKHDDELLWEGIPRPVYADAVSDLGISMRPSPFKGRDDELAAVRPMGHLNKVQTQTQDDELAHMTEFVREPRYAGETYGKSSTHADDELVYASMRMDPGMVRKPYYETVDEGIWKRPMGNIRYFDAENDDELAVVGEKLKQVREPRLIGDFPINWPGMPVYADDELAFAAEKPKHHKKEPRLIGDFPINWPGQPVYADDELIMFADMSLDNKPRKGIFDPRELTKPWYQQQQTMYADDADNELLWYRKPEKDAKEEKPTKVNDLKTGKVAMVQRVKPPKRPLKPIKEADDANDDELIMFADRSLDARLEKRRVPVDLKELTKPWYEQRHTMYADDSLVALGELLEDN